MDLLNDGVYIGGGQFATKPFAGYANFDDCVAQNGDQADPDAYCATIMRRVESGRARKKVMLSPGMEAPHGMAALFLGHEEANLLAVAADASLQAAGIQPEAPEELHITLAYFPAIYDRDALIHAVAISASMLPGSLTTSVEGMAEFLPKNGDKVPAVAIVDPRGLEDAHEMICDVACQTGIEVSEEHGFTPHITLAYAPVGNRLQVELPPPAVYNFSTLSLVIGDERYDFRLGGPGRPPEPEAPAMGMPSMYMSLLRDKFADAQDATDDAPVSSLASQLPAGHMSTATISSPVACGACAVGIPTTAQDDVTVYMTTLAKSRKVLQAVISAVPVDVVDLHKTATAAVSASAGVPVISQVAKAGDVARVTSVVIRSADPSAKPSGGFMSPRQKNHAAVGANDPSFGAGPWLVDFGPTARASAATELSDCHTVRLNKELFPTMHACQHPEMVSQLRATWTTSYINDLPDSAFLFIESGGSKDGEGKTEPRGLRHFPVRGSDGAIDLPHLRNAIARLPQSNARGLTPARVSSLQDRARRMLEDATKEKAGQRVAGSWRSRLAEIVSSLKEVLSWANYDDAEDLDEEVVEKALEDMEVGENTFVVFKDNHGIERWLAFSSNGFEDREKEIVATAALQDAVDFADVTGRRGPLRLWHTPGADIGETDFQAIQGRFLVESGTFLDTPLGQKAKEYFQGSQAPFGISIGFLYPEDQFDGSVYKTIRFLERSVCPHDSVANPWTTFNTLKGESMNQVKAAWLAEVIGDDLAAQVIKTADTATKELEGAVAFKADDGDAFVAALTTVKDAIADQQPAVKEAFATFVKALDAAVPAEPAEPAPEPAKEPEAVAKKDAEPDPTPAPDFIATLKDLLTPIAASVAAIGDRMTSVEERLDKAAEKADDTPRGASVYRGSAAGDNLLDAAKAKELLGDSQAPVSPVKAYIDDILKIGGSGA